VRLWWSIDPAKPVMSLETLTSEQSCWYTRVTARAVEPPFTRVNASSQYMLGVLWDSIPGKKN